MYIFSWTLDWALCACFNVNVPSFDLKTTAEVGTEKKMRAVATVNNHKCVSHS